MTDRKLKITYRGHSHKFACSVPPWSGERPRDIPTCTAVFLERRGVTSGLQSFVRAPQLVPPARVLRRGCSKVRRELVGWCDTAFFDWHRPDAIPGQPLARVHREVSVCMTRFSGLKRFSRNYSFRNVVSMRSAPGRELRKSGGAPSEIEMN